MSVKSISLALLFLVGTATIGATIVRADDDTLYQDMGGTDNVKKIANDTVDNFLSDDRIKATFDNTNIDRLREKLAEQFCVVAGGPCTYTGHSMAAAHKGLHLTNANFNAVVEDVQKAMDKEGVSFATQNRFLARLAPMQHDVVTR